MNEEPPEELAAVVKRNADIAVRKRLHKFCETILADTSGLPVLSDLDFKLSALIVRKLIPVRKLARSVMRTIDPDDDLICLRLCSGPKEYIIMWDEDFVLVSIQKMDSMQKDVHTRPGFSAESPRLPGQPSKQNIRDDD